MLLLIFHMAQLLPQLVDDLLKVSFDTVLVVLGCCSITGTLVLLFLKQPLALRQPPLLYFRDRNLNLQVEFVLREEPLPFSLQALHLVLRRFSPFGHALQLLLSRFEFTLQFFVGLLQRG